MPARLSKNFMLLLLTDNKCGIIYSALNFAGQKYAQQTVIKTAVFGGAFDPPHEEHIKAAAAALKELGLERVILMPTADSPHKRLDAPFALRVEMLKAWPLPEGVQVSTLEFDTAQSAGKNYTADSLPKWKREFGELYFLIGGDSLVNLHKWNRPESIVKAAPLLVVERQGENAAQAAEMWRQKGAEIHFLQYKPRGVSSTRLRTHIRLYGTKPAELSGGAYGIILKNKLYREYDGVLKRLKAALDEEKFEHSLSVAEYAAGLADKVGVDYKQAMLAALLHDCKKQQRDYRGEIDPYALDTAVEHQFAGAIAARREYGVEDQDVLAAIACHCTGKPDMGKLDKLIYVADKLEKHRAYKGVEALRALVEADFDSGFTAVLADQQRVIRQKRLQNVYPLSQKTYEYYLGS